jgi:hypothetical protein
MLEKHEIRAKLLLTLDANRGDGAAAPNLDR